MNEIDSLKRLDLNLLVSLHELFHSNSVTDASKRMGVTQSAMSHQLKRLREIFADPLFVTTVRPMQPTPRASELRGLLGEVLKHVAEMTRSITPFDPNASERRFVVATSDITEVSMASKLRRAIRPIAPKVRLSFVRRPADLKDSLEDGRVDFAVLPTGVPGIEDLAGPFRRRRVGVDGFRVLMRREHPAAARNLTLRRYLSLEHLLVSPSGAPGGLVDGVLRAMGKSRRVALQLSHFVSAPFVVAETDLLLTCPAQFAEESTNYINLIAVKPPLPLPKVDAHVYWHERFHEEPGHRWFRELVFKAQQD